MQCDGMQAGLSGAVTPPTDPSIATQAAPAMPIGDMPAGPSTVDFSEDDIGIQGNWVKKRRWVREAQDVMNDVQVMLLDIKKFRRENYEEKALEVDTAFETFYRDLGVLQGDVDQLFVDIMQEVDKKIARVRAQPQGSIEQAADKEEELYEMADQLVDYKSEIEQLRLDVKSVEELDRSIGARIDKLDECIGHVHDEMQNAQRINKLILHILDHDKARAAYYQLKGTVEKIKVYQQYVKETLATDFSSVIDQIKSHIQKTQDAIKSVEDKGVGVRKRVTDVSEELKKEDDAQGAAQQAAASADQKEAAAKKRSGPISTKTGVIDFIREFCTAFWSMITAAWNSLVGMVK